MRMGSDQYSENGMAINGARVRHCITTYHSVSDRTDNRESMGA